MDDDDFPHLLRAERERAGLSMARLAEAAGLDTSMISRLERGLRTPMRETICRLCEGLGFDDDDARAHALYLAAGFVPPWYRVAQLEKIGP